jgi:hypothetical protein
MPAAPVEVRTCGVTDAVGITIPQDEGIAVAGGDVPFAEGVEVSGFCFGGSGDGEGDQYAR